MERISTPPPPQKSVVLIFWTDEVWAMFFFSEILEKNTDFMISPKAFDEKHIFWKNLKNHAPDLVSRSP